MEWVIRSISWSLERRGKGKRTGVFGSFLLAVYDPINDQYQSITKIETGFSEEDLETNTRNLRALETSGSASNCGCLVSFAVSRAPISLVL